MALHRSSHTHEMLERAAVALTRAPAISGAGEGRRAARHPPRRSQSRPVELPWAHSRSRSNLLRSTVISGTGAPAKPQCKAASTQRAVLRTAQACRVLAAAMAAALAVQTAPAYSAQATRASGTLEVDRAWMEELLMTEMDSRITKMSDKELVTAFKEMLQARKPGATLAASNSGPLGPLQQLSDRLQGFQLGWPWQQHQAPLPESNNAAADSKVAGETGENTPTGSSSTDLQEGSPSPAAARQSELESPKTALSTNQESAHSSSLPFSPRNETETPSGDSSRELPSLSIASRDTEKQEEARNSIGKDAAASEKADQTGSLLKASGLPFQLQEDGLPDVAPHGSQQITPGGKGVSEVLRGGVAAVSAAAAAVIDWLRAHLPAAQEALSDIPESVGQATVIAGTLGGMYILAQTVTQDDAQGAVDPASQQQQADLQSTQVPQGSSSNGILASAAASIQLLPHLLGFPVKLTASDEVLPSPGPLPGPEGAPREAKLSYKGAMLDGLQASRKLHNARPHGHAAPGQSQETYQTPPGAPTSADAGVLWQRSAPAAQPAPDVPSPLPRSPDGALLWRRNSSGLPSSLVFPRAAEEAPNDLSVGQPGQAAPPQRHVSRASALLDNVAPAAANGIWRPPARQQNGSTAQSGTLSAKSAQIPGGVMAGEEDPWRSSQDTIQQGRGTAVGSDSPEHWIAMHELVQPRGEDPWIDGQNPEARAETTRKNGRDEGGQVVYPANQSGAERSRDMSGVVRGFSRPEGPAVKKDLFSNVEMLR